MSFLRDSYAALGGAVVPPLLGASLTPHITVLRRMRAAMADQRKPLSTAALRPSQADWSLFLALCSETLGLDKWKTQRYLERIEAGYPSNPYRTH